MAGKKRYKKRPYYGKKGGAAEYNNELTFDVFTTLERLRDFYKGQRNN